jgi:NAD-dependent DNA ligase
MAYTVSQRIEYLRKELIVNRILYYVECRPLLPDAEYDKLERELRRLCDSYPDEATSTAYYAICPTIVLGSDMEDSYPPELVKEAKDRL